VSFDTDPYIAMTIAGEDVDCAAWFMLNKAEFADLSAPQTSDNVSLPGVNGVLPRQTFDDQATVDGRWVMTGTVAPNGTPYEDPAAGLAANKRLFRQRYFRASRDANGCVASTITDVDDTEVVADVQPDAPQFSEGLFEANVVMSVVVPRGEYLEAGS
jgi:hypothetical protein